MADVKDIFSDVYQRNVRVSESRAGEGSTPQAAANIIREIPRLAQAPRCGAWTRSGTECKSPAVSGKRRCRMHGGTNTGAPIGNRNARKHGGYSAKAMAAARFLKMIARLVRDVN